MSTPAAMDSLANIFRDPAYLAHEPAIREAREHVADLTTRRNRAKGDARKTLTKRLHAAQNRAYALSDAQNDTLKSLLAAAGIAY